MSESPTKRSILAVWSIAAFVVAMFLLVWTTAMLRLHSHYGAEAFLQRSGWVDSAIVLIAPFAISGRLLQAHRDAKRVKAHRA